MSSAPKICLDVHHIKNYEKDLQQYSVAVSRFLDDNGTVLYWVYLVMKNAVPFKTGIQFPIEISTNEEACDSIARTNAFLD